MLTSYAKKTNDMELKKSLFEQKNSLFASVANNLAYKQKLNFKLLISKNFRVIEYCKSCREKNTQLGLAKNAWKYCENCKIDRQFFNVLSMKHNFRGGHARIFLSHDHFHLLKNTKAKEKAPLGDYKEEMKFNKYIYSIQNLDAISFDSVINMYQKLVVAKN